MRLSKIEQKKRKNLKQIAQKLDGNYFAELLKREYLRKHDRLTLSRVQILTNISRQNLYLYLRRGVFKSARRHATGNYTVAAWEAMLIRFYFDHYDNFSLPRWLDFCAKNLHAEIEKKRFQPDFD
jgi:hypothetical protein